MKAERIQYLILQYNAENLSESEEQELEKAIEDGWIDISDLEDLHELDQKLDQLLFEMPEEKMKAEFYEMMEREKEQQPTRVIPMRRWINIGIAASILLVGWMGGSLWNTGAQEETSIAELSNELKSMREMVMLSLIEKESSSDRLRAVNLTDEMDQASEQVTEALLRTLNEDENTNVRLAALDALKVYANQPIVREGLIKSIRNQRSPLVQMALAEIMVAIQEKRSLKEFEHILKEQPMAPPVKEQLKKEIEVLL